MFTHHTRFYLYIEGHGPLRDYLDVIYNIEDKQLIGSSVNPGKISWHLSKPLVYLGQDQWLRLDLPTEIRFAICSADLRPSPVCQLASLKTRYLLEKAINSLPYHDNNSVTAVCSPWDYTPTMPVSMNTSTSDLAGWILLHKRVITIAFGNHDLRDINFAAVNDPDIGLRKLLSRALCLIKAFASSLEAEASNNREGMFASALGTTPIVMLVVAWMISRVNFSRVVQNNIAPKAVDRDRSRQHRTSAKLKSFVLNSKSYREYKKQLLRFAHAPYEGRLSRALGARVIGDDGSNVHKMGLLVRELSWVPTKFFSLSNDSSLHVADRAKGYIEDVMGESWDWGPWSPRRHRLRNGFCRFGWKTVSVHHSCTLEISNTHKDGSHRSHRDMLMCPKLGKRLCKT